MRPFPILDVTIQHFEGRKGAARQGKELHVEMNKRRSAAAEKRIPGAGHIPGGEVLLFCRGKLNWIRIKAPDYCTKRVGKL